MQRWLIPILLACMALPCALPKIASATPERHVETIAGDVAVEITRFPSDGPYLALWIAPGYGAHREHEAFGAALAETGIEVWMVDLVDAFFMERDRNAMLRIDPDAVAELALAAFADSNKSVVLMATGDAAIPALRGARAWQAGGGPAGTLLGAVLLSPELNRAVPVLGDEPELLPIVRATRVPLFILQSGLRTNARQLPALRDALEAGGSAVYTRLLPGVSVMFEEDARSAEAASTIDALPRQIAALLPMLAATSYPAEPAAMPGDPVTERPALDAALRPLPDPRPAQPIALTDIGGNDWRIDDYRGRVTVVNFWATWCPTCVEEVPALNRLQAAMADQPFRLISIDSGETAAVVDAFRQRVPVEFPILMDTDSTVTSTWRVVALPSTFVVGPDGRVRYGTNGAIHWDAPEVIETLKALMDQAKRAGPSFFSRAHRWVSLRACASIQKTRIP